MPGEPVALASRWAATSNVEVGQTTYSVNGGRLGREGRGGSEGQSQTRRGKERVKWNGPGALS